MKPSEREAIQEKQSHTAVLQTLIAKWKRGEVESEDFTFQLIGLSANADQLEAESAVLRNTISLLKGENERLANSVEELVVFMLQERERLTEESE